MVVWGAKLYFSLSIILRVNDKGKMGSEICEVSGCLVPQVHGFDIRGSTNINPLDLGAGEWDDLVCRVSSATS
jgi:hypothetical protein